MILREFPVGELSDLRLDLFFSAASGVRKGQ
jgi:hypothetical protein